MFSMSSSRPKETLTSEPLPCPECGEEKMVSIVENCTLDDGTVVKKLRHHKCIECGSRFFSDDAMHRIQSTRHTHEFAHAV